MLIYLLLKKYNLKTSEKLSTGTPGEGLRDSLIFGGYRLADSLPQKLTLR